MYIYNVRKEWNRRLYENDGTKDDCGFSISTPLPHRHPPPPPPPPKKKKRFKLVLDIVQLASQRSFILHLIDSYIRIGVLIQLLWIKFHTSISQQVWQFEVDVFDLPSSFFIASTGVKILTYSQDIKRAKEKQQNEMESTKQYMIYLSISTLLVLKT